MNPRCRQAARNFFVLLCRGRKKQHGGRHTPAAKVRPQFEFRDILSDGVMLMQTLRDAAKRS